VFSGFIEGNFRAYTPGSVVGIATAYGLDGPVNESQWGRDFPHMSRPARYNEYRVFPGGKVRPRRDADPSPPSSVEVKNSVELSLYSP
jgi:hypothetical protein